MKKRKIVLAGLLTVSLAVPMPVGAAVEVTEKSEAETVSYTHLDVYKRQAKAFRGL